ncbi:MAG: hypothetical protein EOO52_15750 [Gammaproteobacteria bacterium]|nr:MAG: hypothetical protein EOO52_15750 [Gammaproteobacteria bacterium]
MKFLLALFLGFLSVVVFADPLKRFNQENIVEAVALKDKLVGTAWVYKWRGREYTFVFEADGSISKLSSWSMVKWVVISKNEVVLEGINDRMVLLFNTGATRFTTMDWNGQKSSGNRFISDK